MSHFPLIVGTHGVSDTVGTDAVGQNALRLGHCPCNVLPLMRIVLKDLPHLLSYFDDSLVHTRVGFLAFYADLSTSTLNPTSLDSSYFMLTYPRQPVNFTSLDSPYITDANSSSLDIFNLSFLDCH
ncbi:hypothetical protein PoB_004988400 [Plakobranchus ocellatus]|uniref:Uncharacterized protein n=1 Tax=Plakobranchus ocellatus TaxID=259542 RepID=A0AAV4BX53_9GAST|nr:hypothetical protein PoB_004988400 [Plakobranchus ocellatus]